MIQTLIPTIKISTTKANNNIKLRRKKRKRKKIIVLNSLIEEDLQLLFLYMSIGLLKTQFRNQDVENIFKEKPSEHT